MNKDTIVIIFNILLSINNYNINNYNNNYNNLDNI